MSKSGIFEGKTTNEAIEKGLKEFGVSKDKVEIKVIEEEKRSFFSILDPRVVKVEITLKNDEDINSKAKEKVIEELNEKEIEDAVKEFDLFLKEFVSKLPTPNVEYKVFYKDSYLNVEIIGDDLNYLIGYRGDTLNSIQAIFSAYAAKLNKKRVRVILDIGNYKEKRKRTLENLADKTANRVIKTRRQIALEPMHPYERKIIHSRLQDNNKVKTFSVGEEPHRKIVIALK